ncbi:hypothetical protein CTA2_4417 [Colletotrichum tanaceti]|nr:hypothetical protein CTA2_4417 [Colletotrichum tanaceti]
MTDEFGTTFTGTFDSIVELPVYITMILWRIRRNDHRLLSYLTTGLCVWVLAGACTEVAVTVYLLHKSWDRWGHVWKFVTPFVFSLWIATQLYGASRLWAMSRSEWRQCLNKGTPQEMEPAIEQPGPTLDDERDGGGGVGVGGQEVTEESKSKAT